MNEPHYNLYSILKKKIEDLGLLIVVNCILIKKYLY